MLAVSCKSEVNYLGAFLCLFSDLLGVESLDMWPLGLQRELFSDVPTEFGITMRIKNYSPFDIMDSDDTRPLLTLRVMSPYQVTCTVLET